MKILAAAVCLVFGFSLAIHATNLEITRRSIQKAAPILSREFRRSWMPAPRIPFTGGPCAIDRQRSAARREVREIYVTHTI